MAAAKDFLLTSKMIASPKRPPFGMQVTVLLVTAAE